MNNETPNLPFPVLIGDIGGTNARFQIIKSATAEPLSFEAIRTEDFETVEEAIRESVLKQSPVQPLSAVIAAAGPITANGLHLTNCDWKIEPTAFLSGTACEHLILLNDFEAQALSLPVLKDEHLSSLGPKDAVAQNDKTKAVLGPGTGLGVGLLVFAGGTWIPVPGEGGHVDLGPRNERESAVWQNLEKAAGRVSAEQVLCGDGLRNLYTAVCATDGVEALFERPEDISSAAIAGKQQQATEALEIFCTALGRVAGDLALTGMAQGGVYVSGGIGRKILQFLCKSGFRTAFEDKAPHGKLVQTIETSIVTHDVPALLGLAAFVCQPLTYTLNLNHRYWHN